MDGWIWIGALALYVLFRLWYDNWRGPLTKEEIDAFFAEVHGKYGGGNDPAVLRSFLEADDGLELRDHDFDRLFQSFLRRNRTVSLDHELQSVEVRSVSDSHLVYVVVCLQDWRESRIEADGSDVYSLLVKELLCYEADSLFDSDFHLDFSC